MPGDQRLWEERLRRIEPRIHHAIRVRLKSREALAVYAKHDLHVKLKKENIIPLLDTSQKDPVCAVAPVSKDATDRDRTGTSCGQGIK